MLKKPIPGWILAGGFALSAIGGCVNAVGLLGFHRQALSHMSGTLTGVGISLALGHDGMLLQALAVLISFFFGAFVSGFVVQQSTLQLGRRYGLALALESVLLFLAVYFLRENHRVGDYLAAMACGLQNGMATSYSGAVIRTTHVTGIVTDLGIALGHFVRNQPVEWRRIRLYGILLLGFGCGSFLGGFGFSRLGSDTLLFPAGVAGLCGIGFALIKHLEQRLHRRTQQTSCPSL
jgi:uncharacterized membrane protein YoaK (UPF0700 family)